MTDAPAQLREFQLFDELKTILREQERPPEDIAMVERAFEYARQMHDGQKRKNSENYITHPVSVAILLATIPVDTSTVAAALLHDVLEDTDARDEDIRAQFGEDVLKLVEGVTKLGKFQFASKEDRQAENFRKMFLAMADDIRVILLKLGDRLHNMQTLEHMKPEKQMKIAGETLEIFAPLANRMGMGKIRAELEDLSLKYLDPDKFTEIEKEVVGTHEAWEKTIQAVFEKIQNQLEAMGIEAKIYGRVKNYYSIYRKMQVRQKSVDEIYDLSAVRVVVNSEKECYEVLGVIHSAFTPIPGRFKDYIAMPKSNLYQSLHTTVIGPSGQPLEVQIRTHEMHRIAEYGIAAHWKYKETGGSLPDKISVDERKMSWLKQMLEMKDETEDARDYVDSVKLDLFRDEVFVFTPRGKVVVLPRDSTPVDFAYRIHTEVGNTCTGAIANGKIVPLNYRLKNGDILEIITNKKSTPRIDWINFVQTQQAKSRIRQFYKKHYREEHEEEGRRMMDEALSKAHHDEAVKSGALPEVAKDLNYSGLTDLYSALGYGEINATRVINRLKKKEAPQKTQEDADYNLHRLAQVSAEKPAPKTTGEITGLEGMVYRMAKCCNPLPGEPIVGVVTRQRGVMVHREDCINLISSNPNRQMDIRWEGEPEKKQQYTVKLDIHVIDRVGVLKDILAKIADLDVNISDTKVKLYGDQTASVGITVQVTSLQHLEQVKRAIRHVPDVIAVKRVQSQSLRQRGTGS